MPISKSKRKKQTGQHESVGRFGLKGGGFGGIGFTGFGSQVAAFQIAGWAGLFLCVMCISGSTLADSAQKKFSGLGDAALAGGVRMGDGQSFGVFGQNALWEVNRRHALLRYVRARAGAVRKLHPNEMTLLFGSPSFERTDGDLRMWQFASGVCALDVYYRGGKRPVYAEYRVRGSAEHGGKVVKGAGVSHQECAESLFENGGF